MFFVLMSPMFPGISNFFRFEDMSIIDKLRPDTESHEKIQTYDFVVTGESVYGELGLPKGPITEDHVKYNALCLDRIADDVYECHIRWYLDCTEFGLDKIPLDGSMELDGYQGFGFVCSDDDFVQFFKNNFEVLQLYSGRTRGTIRFKKKKPLT